MGRATRRLAGVVSLVVAIGVAGIVAAPAASAAPKCSVSSDRGGATATCSGSGQFRVGHTCQTGIDIFGNPKTHTVYSAWVKSPACTWVNHGSCGGAGAPYRGFVETK